MEELNERTAKRRANTTEQDEEMQQAIREAEQRRDRRTPTK
jgi:hypothetical protein